MSARHKARELILKALYAFELGGQPAGEAFSSLSNSSKLDKDTKDFAHRLFETIVPKIDKLDQEIEALASNWKLERIATVDKNILRLSMTELSDFPDIPKKVSINEAIELAKRYGSAESPRFVNGILDNFASKIS